AGLGRSSGHHVKVRGRRGTFLTSTRGAGLHPASLLFSDYKIVLQPTRNQTEIFVVALTPTALRLRLWANGYAPLPKQASTAQGSAEKDRRAKPPWSRS